MTASGRRPTRKEIGDAVGMSEMQVDRCIAAMEQRIHSLDQEIRNMKKPMNGGERAETLIDIIESRSSDECNLELNRVLLREDLIDTLQRHLTAEEVELLLLRYGFKKAPSDDGRDVAPTNRQTTIAELSRIMGLKPDKVRRMINRALQQLKKADMDELLAYERDL
jgi:RNA polymerase primary sigma factor